MKFLVLGCNGMAGHILSLYLKERGHDVFGFDRRESNLIKSVSGDARNTDQLRQIITDGKYDTIIKCNTEIVLIKEKMRGAHLEEYDIPSTDGDRVRGRALFRRRII